MRRFAATTCVWVWMAGFAFAQAPLRPGAGDEPRGYLGGVAQASFGNVTSQSYGVEGGYPLTSSFDIFGELGRVLDAAPSSAGQSAQLIANQIALTQSGVAYTVQEPVLFFDAGVRYRIDLGGKLIPYLIGGVGFGQVKPDAQFTINGTNINGRLDQFGVVLGSDLSGSTTKFMAMGGLGAVYPLGNRFYLDAEFRYNRVFISGGDIPFTRVGVGAGVRF